MQDKEAARVRPVTPNEVSHSEDRVLETVRQALRQIEYGSVLIKVHQGTVVGIETSTKLRFGGRPTEA